MGIVQDQASEFLAPELEKILVIAVDETSRQYDLSALDLGTPGADVAAGGKPAKSLYVTIYADGAPIYWALSATAGRTITPTTATAVGTAPSFGTTQCWKCPLDAEQSRRVDRNRLRYLYLRTSIGTGYARIKVSSSPSDAVPSL